MLKHMKVCIWLFVCHKCKVSSFLLLGQWSKECASLRHLLKEPNCLKVRSMRSCLCVYCFSLKSFLLQGPHRESEAKQSTPEVKKFYLWNEELMRKRKLAITSPPKMHSNLTGLCLLEETWRGTARSTSPHASTARWETSSRNLSISTQLRFSSDQRQNLSLSCQLSCLRIMIISPLGTVREWYKQKLISRNFWWRTSKTRIRFTLLVKAVRLKVAWSSQWLLSRWFSFKILCAGNLEMVEYLLQRDVDAPEVN